MKSTNKIYNDNANQCEARAQEMPPTLRREILALAENWRRLAFKADEPRQILRKKAKKTRSWKVQP